MNEEEIRKVFGRFGEIANIKTGHKDFVFIDFTDMEACDRAMKAMNGIPFDEHSTGGMKVVLADPSRDGKRKDDGGGYRRFDRERNGMRQGDRNREIEIRRRSRSPAGRGGGAHPFDTRRPRSRSPRPPDTRRPRSRSPRADRRDAPMPPPPGNPPYRSRSRERMDARERMMDSRALGGDAGRVRDEMPMGDRGDPRFDLDRRRQFPDDAGYGRPAMSDVPPRPEGRERLDNRGGKGGGFRGGTGYDETRDPRYDAPPRAREARFDGPSQDVRREDPRGYPPARDDMRQDPDYGRQASYDTRPGSYERPDVYAGADSGRTGGSYRGEPPYDSARGTARDGGRGYDVDAMGRDRQPAAGAYAARVRSRSRERPRAAVGPPLDPPFDRHSGGYDDVGTNRAMPREMDRGPPRREPNRNDDHYASQRSGPTGGERGDYTHGYPPRGGGDAAYPRRDEYPRRDGGRAPEGYREYEDVRGGDTRHLDARAYVGGKGDNTESGRNMDSHSQVDDIDYRSQPKLRGAAFEHDDVQSRAGGPRSLEQRQDRMPNSPPRAVRVGSDMDGSRNVTHAYQESYGTTTGGRSEGIAGTGGAREVDSLPPTDLRRVLRKGERDASSGGSWPASQKGPETMPAGEYHAGNTFEHKGETLSEIEAQRRRQRAERFSANAANAQVLS